MNCKVSYIYHTTFLHWRDYQYIKHINDNKPLNQVYMYLFADTLENRAPLMRQGASVEWPFSFPLMNSFNKSGTAFSPCKLCFLRTLPSLRIILLYFLLRSVKAGADVYCDTGGDHVGCVLANHQGVVHQDHRPV